MCLGFRPLPSELPFLHKRLAPRFVLVWLKQESRIGKIHNWHNFTYFLTSKTFLNHWREANRENYALSRKTKICPVTSPCFFKDRIHFRKFQWDLQYFLCDLRYVMESGLFIWRLGLHVQVSVHAWRGSTVNPLRPAHQVKALGFVSLILKCSSNPIYWQSSLSPQISKRRMTEIAYLKKIKPYSPNSRGTCMHLSISPKLVLN